MQDAAEQHRDKFSNIARCCQLHEEVRIVYVVDGYQVQFAVRDGSREVLIGSGPTVEAALLDLDQQLEKFTLDELRAL